MLTFDNIHPDLRVVGELLDQGHDLAWNRRVTLFMVVPKAWPIPSHYEPSIMYEGFLGFDNAHLLVIPFDFRLKRSRLVRQDQNKAMQYINHFCFEVQKEYWKELYSQGVILAVRQFNIDECAGTQYWMPRNCIEVYVPKARTHRQPEAEEDAEILEINAQEHSVRFYPKEPEHPEDYDQFWCTDVSDYQINHSAENPFLCFGSFEAVRKAIANMKKRNK